MPELAFVHTFVEQYTEEQTLPDEPWTTRMREGSIDKQINDFVSREKALIVGLTPLPDELSAAMNDPVNAGTKIRLRTIRYVLVFAKTAESPDSGETDMPIPLKKNATAPTVEATRMIGKEKRAVQAMAGVFGVPEGDKLHPDDDELAPVTLLSPDFEVWKYEGLFGNIKAPAKQDKK